MDYQENGEMVDKEGIREVVYIALENAVNGELIDIVAETGPLPDAVTRFYMCQLLDALEYIHQLGISH